MGPALMLALIGFLDDKSGLGVRSRLISQIIAGTVVASLLISNGTQTSIFGHWWIDAPITIFWVVGIVNAMNFLDNMDGLSGSIGLIAGLAFAALAASNGQYLVTALALALAGACGGFLIFNWSPASIYMGDAGALFIGCILAVIAIRLNLSKVSQPVSLIAKLLVLALPILDTTTVVISRLRRRVSPLTGGRDHLSHRIATKLENPKRSADAITRFTVLSLGSMAILSGAVALSIAG
jgi:UDP-GlcNAc:undecaprenyl-phosphate GlcNAc-1-phosphate transferase